MGDLMVGRAGLVTGAASGIGRACAVRLAQEGASVVVADLESARERGAETVREILDSGGAAEFAACDVSRAEDAAALVENVVERYGRLDFAHNNAGIPGAHTRLADVEDEDFDNVVAVNLRGTFLGMKHQIRHMVRHGGGTIVNTSSNAGLRGIQRIGAYSASKHGIVGLTRTAAVEYANDGVRVNAVCPGAVMTRLMADQPPERQREIVAPHAIDRAGQPGEVAAAVAWLCSEQASFVTGVAMPVDAGSVAGW